MKRTLIRIRCRQVVCAVVVGVWGCIPLSETAAFDVPTNVTASWGMFSNRIQVAWGDVGVGAYYRVYRVDENNTRTAATSYFQGLSFDDNESALVVKGKNYRYQVRSATSGSGSGVSGYSTASDIGFMGFPLSLFGESGLSFTSGGAAPWVGQYDTNGIALLLRSGRIIDSQETWVETTVDGRGTISFDWRTDSEAGYDVLRFEVNGVETGYELSSNGGWVHRTFEVLGTGTSALRWIYRKDEATSTGLDSAWIGSVAWEPESGNLVGAPFAVSASDGQYLDHVRISWEPVSHATHYQVSWADSSNGVKTVIGDWIEDLECNDWGANPGTVYYYFVRAATNDVGTGASVYSLPDTGYVGVRPENDMFLEAQTFGGLWSGVQQGDCTLASVEPSEPVHDGFFDATNSVWWIWNATTNAMIQVEVQGSVSNFNPVVAVYTNVGATVGTLVPVAAAEKGTNAWAVATFDAVEGLTYWIAVAGRDAAGSPLTVRWAVKNWLCGVPEDVEATDGTLFERVRVTWAPVPGATWYQVWRRENLRPGTPLVMVRDWEEPTSFDDLSANPDSVYYYYVRAACDESGWLAGAYAGPEGGYAGTRPWNDNLVSADGIDGTIGFADGDNTLATVEPGEPVHGGFSDATHSIWWAWTAPSNAVYAFTTEGSDSAVDQVLAVYTNVEEGVGGLLPVAADQRGSNAFAQVVFEAVQGERYRIAVAGRHGGGGVVLNWEKTSWLLPAPVNVRASDGTVLWATRVTWDPVPGAAYYEVSRALAIDGEKEVLTGWMSDTSFDDWSGDLGQVYYYFVRAADVTGLRISGYGLADTGIAGERPPNDNVADAWPLSGAMGTVSGDSTLATREIGEPQHGGYSDAGASIWYLWTAPVSAPVIFSTQPGVGFDAVVAVYSNAEGTVYSAVASATRGTNEYAEVTFDAQVGVTYRVAVAGRSNTGGPVSLNWSYGTWGFPAPAGVSASRGTYLDEVLVGWSAVSGAAFYEVSRADKADGAKTVVRGWSASLSFVDATSGQSHFYFVRSALDSLGTLAGAYGGPAEGWGASRPVNDLLARASVFSNTVTTVWGDNTWATFEPEEPPHGGWEDATNSIWWCWSAPSNGVATVDTQGSALSNVVVAVYTNGADGLVAVAAEEQGTNAYALVRFGAGKEVVYWIAVAGRQGACGAVALNRTLTVTGSGAPPPPVIVGFVLVTTNAVSTWQIRLEAKAGVTYEVLTTAVLSTNTVWESLSPAVTGRLEEADGILELELPMQAPTAFFRAVAVQWGVDPPPAEPPAQPVITGITAARTAEGATTVRLTFTCEADVGYEVKWVSALPAGSVWQGLVPPVEALATADGFMALEVTLAEAWTNGFFKIEASR